MLRLLAHLALGLVPAHPHPAAGADYCDQLVDGVQEGQPACLRTEPDKYADADKYGKKCTYLPGWAQSDHYIDIDHDDGKHMRAADGEACSRMVQTMHPTADGAYYAVNYCGAMFGPSGGDPNYYYGLHDEYMSCVFEAGHDQCSSGSDSCEHANDGLCDDGGPGSDSDACAFGTDCSDCSATRTATCTDTCGDGSNIGYFVDDGECDDGGRGSDHGRIGTVYGKDRYCALGTDCTDCGPRPRAQGWPTGRAAQLGVCRPAVLPEKVGPSQIKSAALLEKELKTLGHAPCPGDARLVIAHLAPVPARDALGLTRAICACDHYVAASSVPLAGERMCAKDMLDPTAAGGRFQHLDHTPVMCYPPDANFPAVGKDDGGALAWHGCRSDQRPCTMPFTCAWTPGFALAPIEECTYSPGWAQSDWYIERDDDGEYMTALNGEACSRMIKSMFPAADGAYFAPANWDGAPDPGAPYCAAMFGFNSFGKHGETYYSYSDTPDDPPFTSCVFKARPDNDVYSTVYVGKASNAQACSAMVQNKAPEANGAIHQTADVLGLRYALNNDDVAREVTPTDGTLGSDCFAVFFLAHAPATPVTDGHAMYTTCKFEGWQTPAAALECTYSPGWAPADHYSEFDAAGNYMRAPDGEACSRMIQSMHPTADGAYFSADAYTGRSHDTTWTTPRGYCAAIFGPSERIPQEIYFRQTGYYFHPWETRMQALDATYTSCIFKASGTASG